MNINMDLNKVILQFAPGIISAFVSSYLSVRWALKRFYSEKVWERKFEAYTKVFDSIHHVKKYALDWQRTYLNGRDMTDERESELKRQSQSGLDEIERITTIGSFLMSNEAVQNLEQLQADLIMAGKAEDIYVYIEKEILALDKCLANLRECARRELEMDKKFRRPQWKKKQSPRFITK